MKDNIKNIRKELDTLQHFNDLNENRSNKGYIKSTIKKIRKELSELVKNSKREEANLTIPVVSNMFCSHCGKRKRTRSGYIEPLCECDL